MKRLQRSREEWRSIVAEWGRRGVAAAAVAVEFGVSRSALYYWRTKFREEGVAPAESLFVPVVPQENAVPTDRVAAVLRGQNVQIEILAEASPNWVAELLRDLDRC